MKNISKNPKKILEENIHVIVKVYPQYCVYVIWYPDRVWVRTGTKLIVSGVGITKTESVILCWFRIEFSVRFSIMCLVESQFS